MDDRINPTFVKNHRMSRSFLVWLNLYVKHSFFDFLGSSTVNKFGNCSSPNSLHGPSGGLFSSRQFYITVDLCFLFFFAFSSSSILHFELECILSVCSFSHNSQCLLILLAFHYTSLFLRLFRFAGKKDIKRKERNEFGLMGCVMLIIQICVFLML